MSMSRSRKSSRLDLLPLPDRSVPSANICSTLKISQVLHKPGLAMRWVIRTGGTTELQFQRSCEVIVYDIF